MSEEEYASKRERQKARRSERLEREAAQAKSQQGRQRLVYAGIIGVVVLLIGGLVYSQIAARQARTELARAVEGRLGELGCTEDTTMPDLGGTHFADNGESMADQAPATLYPDEPPTSGNHSGSVAPTGVFDVPIDPRLTTHNLEHGYLVAHYAPDAPAEEVEALKTWVEGQIDGNRPKMIVAEYYTDLPDDANFAFTAWFQRQLCDTFDAEVLEVFSGLHYDIDGEGPEKGIPTHSVGARGVIDPDGQPLFFPPLDTEFGAPADPSATDAEEASPEVDAEGEQVDPAEAPTP